MLSTLKCIHMQQVQHGVHAAFVYLKLVLVSLLKNITLLQRPKGKLILNICHVLFETRALHIFLINLTHTKAFSGYCKMRIV